MYRKPLMFLAALALTASVSSTALAHCQIPCGIYDDPVRFSQLREHVTTIEKSMNQINTLSEDPAPNVNQLGRWVMNKENHADELTEIVTYYFLTQRVKPADPSDKAATAKYLRQLTLLHQMMVHAMKAKQTTDLEHCEHLRALIDQFEAVYTGKHTHSHGSHDHAH